MEEKMIFDKEKFFVQLLTHRINQEEHPESYLINGKLNVSKSLALLDGMVYKASFNKCISPDRLRDFPKYKDLLLKWKGLKDAVDDSGRHYSAVQIYGLDPVYSNVMRSNFVSNWNLHPDMKLQLEFVISFCLACGVKDKKYITDAVNALCEESLDGKGLRKVLLHGAVFGCWKVGEIAYDGINTGWVEHYYERFLNNPANETVVNFIENEITGNEGRKAENIMKGGTTVTKEKIKACRTTDDFIIMMDDPQVQCGALRDLIDTTHLVKMYIESRQSSFPEGMSSYVYQFLNRADYSDFNHGKFDRNIFFFLKLACVFGFTYEEFDTMIHSLHVTGNPQFNICAAGVKQMCQHERYSYEYREACTKLLHTIQSEFEINNQGEPTNSSIRSFYRVLTKINDYNG